MALEAGHFVLAYLRWIPVLPAYTACLAPACTCSPNACATIALEGIFLMTKEGLCFYNTFNLKLIALGPCDGMLFALLMNCRKNITTANRIKQYYERNHHHTRGNRHSVNMHREVRIQARVSAGRAAEWTGGADSGPQRESPHEKALNDQVMDREPAWVRRN